MHLIFYYYYDFMYLEGMGSISHPGGQNVCRSILLEPSGD